MRFTGNIDAKMDGKGRIFLPAAFRKILLREEIEGLILRRDVFQQCLVLYPENVWNEQVDLMASRASHFDRNGRAALRGFVAGAESITIDGNGRILIPRRYCDAVGLGSDVRFIGMDDTIEIWNRQKADQILEDTDALAIGLEQLMSDNANIEPDNDTAHQ